MLYAGTGTAPGTASSSLSDDDNDGWVDASNDGDDDFLLIGPWCRLVFCRFLRANFFQRVVVDGVVLLLIPVELLNDVVVVVASAEIETASGTVVSGTWVSSNIVLHYQDCATTWCSFQRCLLLCWSLQTNLRNYERKRDSVHHANQLWKRFWSCQIYSWHMAKNKCSCYYDMPFVLNLIVPPHVLAFTVNVTVKDIGMPKLTRRPDFTSSIFTNP